MLPFTSFSHSWECLICRCPFLRTASYSAYATCRLFHLFEQTMRSDAYNDLQIEHISCAKIQRALCVSHRCSNLYTQRLYIVGPFVAAWYARPCHLNVQWHIFHFQTTIYAGNTLISLGTQWSDINGILFISVRRTLTFFFSFGTENDFRSNCNAYEPIFLKKFSRRHSPRNCNSSNTSSNRHEIKFLQRLTPVVKICFPSILFCMFHLISLFFCKICIGSSVCSCSLARLLCGHGHSLVQRQHYGKSIW